jgi:hypothetical protein
LPRFIAFATHRHPDCITAELALTSAIQPSYAQQAAPSLIETAATAKTSDI